MLNMESHQRVATTSSVRTLSPIPASWICRSYSGIFTFGINCSDHRISSKVIEIEMRGDRLVIADQTKTADDEDRLAGNEDEFLWTLHMSPGRDRLEQNMEVIRSQSSGEFYLRTIRRIEANEELFVWYSEELSRELAIPILTPANVQGNLEYVCTSCAAVFQFPNPLKAHIRFHCQSSRRQSTTSTGPPLDHLPSDDDGQHAWTGTKFPIGRLWSAVKSCQQILLDSENEAKKSSSSSSSSPSPSFLSHEGTGLRFTDDLLTLNYMSQLLMPFGRHRLSLLPMPFPFFPSFLHPFGVPSPSIPFTDHRSPSTAETFLAPPTVGSALASSGALRGTPSSSSSSSVEFDRRSSTQMAVPDESVDEELHRFVYTAAATAGRKTKRGYLCGYCGKLYSRKYGLKIHVRTHTGFKPLKCKVCLRPFGDPSNLNKHIRLHAEGDTPYRCHHCGKVLVRRRDLERHIRSRHSNETMTYLEGMSDDNATTVTSSVSLLDEPEEEEEEDEEEEQVDVI